MRFAYEASLTFIGQQKILKELSIIAEKVKMGENVNLLFNAPSGYGKTTLAYMFMQYVDPGYKNSVQYIPDNKGEITFDASKRFHFIDEIHLLKSPESLFGYMGNGSYTFIVATNEFGDLKDTLLRRFLDFQFVSYTEDEIALVIDILFEKRGLEISYNLCKEIAKYCRNSPGIAEKYALRLSFIFRGTRVPDNDEDIHRIMYEFLGTEEGGMTEYDRLYLATLHEMGGLCGLRTLVNHTGLPEATITKTIEPFLVDKKKVKITPRGRSLI